MSNKNFGLTEEEIKELEEFAKETGISGRGRVKQNFKSTTNVRDIANRKESERKSELKKVSGLEGAYVPVKRYTSSKSVAPKRAVPAEKTPENIKSADNKRFGLSQEELEELNDFVKSTGISTIRHFKVPEKSTVTPRKIKEKGLEQERIIDSSDDMQIVANPRNIRAYHGKPESSTEEFQIVNIEEYQKNSNDPIIKEYRPLKKRTIRKPTAIKEAKIIDFAEYNGYDSYEDLNFEIVKKSDIEGAEELEDKNEPKRKIAKQPEKQEELEEKSARRAKEEKKAKKAKKKKEKKSIKKAKGRVAKTDLAKAQKRGLIERAYNVWDYIYNDLNADFVKTLDEERANTPEGEINDTYQDEIEDLEQARKDNAALNRRLIPLKIGIATVGLALAVGGVYSIYDYLRDSYNDFIATKQEAEANTIITEIKGKQLIEEEAKAKDLFLKDEDQEYLLGRININYIPENVTAEVMKDLMQEAWESLEPEIQKWVREPDKYYEAKLKQLNPESRDLRANNQNSKEEREIGE